MIQLHLQLDLHHSDQYIKCYDNFGEAFCSSQSHQKNMICLQSSPHFPQAEDHDIAELTMFQPKSKTTSLLRISLGKVLRILLHLYIIIQIRFMKKRARRDATWSLPNLTKKTFYVSHLFVLKAIVFQPSFILRRRSLGLYLLEKNFEPSLILFNIYHAVPQIHCVILLEYD